MSYATFTITLQKILFLNKKVTIKIYVECWFIWIRLLIVGDYGDTSQSNT